MTTLDSDPEVGTGGAPTPPASGPEGDQQDSKAAYVAKAEFDALVKRLQRLESGAQSEKDRAVKRTNERLDKLEGDVKPLLERAAQLIAKGSSPEDAIAQVNSEQEEELDRRAIRELVSALKSGTLPVPSAGTGQGQGAGVADVIAKAKLDPANPQVVELVRQHGHDLTELALEAGKLAAREKPAPDLSAAPPMTGSGSVAVTPEALRAEYEKKLKTTRGPDAVARLKQEYRRKGLNIW